MSLHLAEISRNVAAGAHALVVLDGASWHQTGGQLRVPDNISLLHLAPSSPELNPAENIWEYLRQNQLSNRVHDNYETIVDTCFTAWNALSPRHSGSDPTQPDYGHNNYSIGPLESSRQTQLRTKAAPPIGGRMLTLAGDHMPVERGGVEPLRHLGSLADSDSRHGGRAERFRKAEGTTGSGQKPGRRRDTGRCNAARAVVVRTP